LKLRCLGSRVIEHQRKFDANVTNAHASSEQDRPQTIQCRYNAMWFRLISIAVALACVLASDDSACGSASITYSTYLAGVVGGKHLPGFQTCCQAHDSCYDTCTSRDQCDLNFGECMRTSCAKRNDAGMDYDDCVSTSGIFQTAVETFGGIAYTENCTEELGAVQLVYDFLQVNTAVIMEQFFSA
jgi:hypothetical protein